MSLRPHNTPKSDNRLGPTRRVKSRADYVRIQNQGDKARTRHFLIATEKPKANFSDSRIGVTITKKVHKRAVQRNFIKRRVRDFFRRNRERMKSNSDVVVVALKGSTELNTKQVYRELFGLFARAGLLEPFKKKA